MKRKREELAFEESLTDGWAKDSDLLEVPLTNRVLFASSLAIFAVALLVVGRVVALAGHGEKYRERAKINLMGKEELQAPRGVIYDRRGKILAENEPSFLIFLDIKKFLENPEAETETLNAVSKILGLEREELWRRVNEVDLSTHGGRVLLTESATQSQVIQLQGANISSLISSEGFRRLYDDGQIFSSVVGYTGLVNIEDLAADPDLNREAVIGRAGVEAAYDRYLRGTSGAVSQRRNAKGEPLGEAERTPPAIGTPLHLTIDAEFQSYFFQRFEEGLRTLGLSSGVGLALNPQSGEILALFNFPSFDNNIFGAPGRNEEKKELLSSDLTPLFNRAVSGLYTPGSTIKPLVAVAALREGVVTPEKEIFSPGYLDLPNLYDPDRPTRFLDWRYQGWVDLRAAIAQSSNVYFYTVGGGFGDLKGLGIGRLKEWWQKFNLGRSTGIDVPGEAKGFLPDPETKRKRDGKPWLLGDTYNVSIGQGDLLLTPIQLLSYIAALANGGKIRVPYIVKNSRKLATLADLSYLSSEIKEVREGMAAATRSPLGTAYLLHDLPFPVAAKTGTAQVSNNTKENAFFVGFAPADERSEIAILILIENSREGSLNTVPIAKDVLNWYYWNRIRK